MSAKNAFIADDIWLVRSSTCFCPLCYDIISPESFITGPGNSLTVDASKQGYSQILCLRGC